MSATQFFREADVWMPLGTVHTYVEEDGWDDDLEPKDFKKVQKIFYDAHYRWVEITRNAVVTTFIGMPFVIRDVPIEPKK